MAVKEEEGGGGAGGKTTKARRGRDSSDCFSLLASLCSIS